MKKRNDPRHLARKVALKILFEQIFHPEQTPKERLKEFTHKSSDSSNTAKPSTKDEQYIKSATSRKKKLDRELLNAIITELPNNLEEIDSIVSECAPEWPLDQIAKVDLTILRIATYELLHHQATPTKVAIDEAVELAKEFGGNNSSRFVNGVLGSVVKKYVKKDLTEKAKPTEKNKPADEN